ncbi:MAG: T9SS type A sorting domain-containing protein, partial [Bacteroidota bacterium]
MRKLVFLLVIPFMYFNGNSQSNRLCPIQEFFIRVDDPNNLPLVSDNGDGTITLTHNLQYITDIFANHTIYGFEQSVPDGSSSNSLEFYTIFAESRDLFNELFTNVPTDIFTMESYYDGPVDFFGSTPIKSELINLLDGQILSIIQYNYTSGICSDPSCLIKDAPDDFELTVEFDYDSQTDMMKMGTVGLSPCGNSFSINLRGGYNFGFPTEDLDLQLWESVPGTTTPSDNTQPCDQIEFILYSMLDIGCFNDGDQDIVVTYDEDLGTVTFTRPNYIFGDHIIVFEGLILSVETPMLDQLKVFETADSPYLQVSGIQSAKLSAEIYNVTGQRLTSETDLTDHQIYIADWPSQVYFIKFTDTENRSKVVNF